MPFQYRNSGIGQVRLLDPLENFPARWRTVLAELPNVTLVQQQVGQGEGFWDRCSKSSNLLSMAMG